MSGPLKEINEDDLEDACSVLFELTAACLDLVKAVLGKIEEFEGDTAIPNLKTN